MAERNQSGDAGYDKLWGSPAPSDIGYKPDVRNTNASIGDNLISLVEYSPGLGNITSFLVNFLKGGSNSTYKAYTPQPVEPWTPKQYQRGPWQDLIDEWDEEKSKKTDFRKFLERLFGGRGTNVGSKAYWRDPEDGGYFVYDPESGSVSRTRGFVNGDQYQNHLTEAQKEEIERILRGEDVDYLDDSGELDKLLRNIDENHDPKNAYKKAWRAFRRYGEYPEPPKKSKLKWTNKKMQGIQKTKDQEPDNE